MSTQNNETYLETVMQQIGQLIARRNALQNAEQAVITRHVMTGRGAKYFPSSAELVRVRLRLQWLEQEARIAAHTPSACSRGARRYSADLAQSGPCICPQCLDEAHLTVSEDGQHDHLRCERCGLESVDGDGLYEAGRRPSGQDYPGYDDDLRAANAPVPQDNRTWERHVRNEPVDGR